MLLELLIRCPFCNTETRLIAEESGLVMFSCQGCTKGVVLQGNAVYNVSDKFVSRIVKRHKTRQCGQVIGSKLSKKSKDLLSLDKINRLHDLLQEKEDVADFLKKLK